MFLKKNAHEAMQGQLALGPVANSKLNNFTAEINLFF